MKYQGFSIRRRQGFTLIELLIVIAIIAVLVSLTASAVMKILEKREVVLARSEISQFSTALAGFKSQYKVYPPSRMLLLNSKQAYGSLLQSTDPTTKALATNSLIVLNKMFPSWVSADWSGGRGMSASGVILEGDQCLVFFLGGMIYQGEDVCTGFSTNQQDPSQRGGSRTKVLYDFKPATRLVAMPGRGPFPSFIDPWGEAPYAYFSTDPTGKYNIYSDSDCKSLLLAPYRVSDTPTYHAADTYQIVSAGADRKFGQGGLWKAVSADQIDPKGKDDMTNFYDNVMGVSP